MFINELFSGSQAEYQEALEKLEVSNHRREALAVLQPYQQKHQWDDESEEVVEFMEILSKKFS